MRSRPAVPHLPATIVAPTVKAHAQASAITQAQAFSPAADCVAGTPLVLMVSNNPMQAAARTFTSVTDSVGNTWSLDFSATNFAVASCTPTSTIHTTDTITIHTSFQATNQSLYFFLLSCPGIQAGVIDQAAGPTSGTTGSSGPVSTASTATLAQPNELALVMWVDITCNSTPTGGFTATSPANVLNQMFVQYEILSTTTALAGTATVDRAVTWNGVIVTYAAALT